MKTRRAFTLIEAIAAVVVVGIAVPPLLWSLGQAHTGRANQILASQARWLAAEGLETALADRHCPSRGYDYLTPANYPAEAQVGGFEQFRRDLSFHETAVDLVTPGEGFLRVTCTVGYTDSAGRARDVSIATVVTDYAP